jgi:predicted Ser/Thr protein kinase/cell division protein FtsL
MTPKIQTIYSPKVDGLKLKLSYKTEEDKSLANARYPNRTRYLSAVRHPQIAFKNLDPKLAGGKPEEITNAQGIKDLWFAAGGFACVFKYQTFNPDKRWAVRCFLQSTSSVANHYSRVSSHLKKINCRSYFTEFLFQDKGIMVDGKFYPIVKMEWVEGENLKDFIRDNRKNKSKLDALAKAWIKLSKDLVDTGIAHGDLQHGNILVDDSNGINLKLIDYDSLYFKVDGNSINDEIKGLAGYQHPLRETLQKQCMEIDFFPQLVIYLSIRAIAEKPQLWKTYNIENTERLLFSLADFQNPNKSKVFNDLSQLPSEISKLAKELQQICNYTDFSKIPPLDTILTPPVQRWNPGTSQQQTTQTPQPTSATTTAIWNPGNSQQQTTQTPQPTSATTTAIWNPGNSQQQTTQTPQPTSATTTTSWTPVTTNQTPTSTAKSSSGGNFVVKALAIISIIAAFALGGFCYYLYEQVREIKQDKGQLKNQIRELKSEQNELQSNVNKIENETNSKLPPGGQIIHSGYLSVKGENNLHIFWVNQNGKFDFKLYDLDSDADFVLLNQQMAVIKNSKQTKGGKQSDSLENFELQPASYYVKVWLHSSQSTSYKLKISRH